MIDLPAQVPACASKHASTHACTHNCACALQCNAGWCRGVLGLHLPRGGRRGTAPQAAGVGLQAQAAEVGHRRPIVLCVPSSICFSRNSAPQLLPELAYKLEQQDLDTEDKWCTTTHVHSKHCGSTCTANTVAVQDKCVMNTTTLLALSLKVSSPPQILWSESDRRPSPCCCPTNTAQEGPSKG